ncbi:hypothetical protein VA7868_03821 [Vibrio aerogenes CECT 7868]|uniref:DUF7919 domain-containing protein n=1 Tax=Vibrio aerogenes CECT 7868 TaxID=1216006 RepID=A0A1M6BKS3_9VIBR|nr:hypothetical protein [Vibrio aerogenes]SHI49267.1 hypothetical protein VA7868_03821 [Vibrio aerogenes CECT 7868]
MFYEDLSNYCYYLKTPVSTVRNVGWLEKDQPYKTGKVLDGFLSKLSNIILGNDSVDAQVNRIRSMHPCSLYDCGMLEIEVNGKKSSLGTAEIWVPSKDGSVFFAAPTMVYHYVEKHSYLPPEKFVSAVMNFDLSMPYKAQDIYLKEIKGHF